MNEKAKKLKLHIVNKPDEENIIIEGVRFHYNFFKQCSATGVAVNVPFIIRNRLEDGSVDIFPLQLVKQQEKKVIIPEYAGPLGKKPT